MGKCTRKERILKNWKFNPGSTYIDYSSVELLIGLLTPICILIDFWEWFENPVIDFHHMGEFLDQVGINNSAGY